jgi:hypothetical protein
MVAATMAFRTLSIQAAIHNNKATLLDRNGIPLLYGVPISRVDGPIHSSVATKWLWKLAIGHMLLKISGDRVRATQDCWKNKADSLAHSFRLRGLDRAHCHEHCRFERYPTVTWQEAAKRMQTQGHNHFRRHARNGWNRWAHTVSNNHNKRKEGRYAANTYSDRQDGPQTY